VRLACRGHLHDKMGEFDAAIRDFSSIIQLNAKNVNAFFSRGFSYDNKGDTESAVADYMLALELDQQG
jgi:Flp pilus assembly protein TadD